MPERKLPVVPNEDLIHGHVMKLADFLGKWTDVNFSDSDQTRNMFHAATAYVAEVVESAQNNIPRAQANEDLAELIAAVRRDQSARHERAILIPEQETEWPSGYDFEALEAADVEETAAMQALESLLVKLEKSDAERKARGE